MLKDNIEELKRILDTVDGRDFLFNFILDSCGVDYTVGIPSKKCDDFEAGRKKPAIDLFNIMNYHCHEKFVIMINEQRQRRDANVRNN